MPVREVYDINSVQDWFRYEFMCLTKGNVLKRSIARTFAKKHENDEIHQAYTKAYRRMDSRKRTMYISKKGFTEWSKTARKKRKLCEEGQLSLGEFQAWLDGVNVGRNVKANQRFTLTLIVDKLITFNQNLLFFTFSTSC